MQTTIGTNLQSHNRCVNNHNAEPTNQPVSKRYGHSILKSAEENYCMGKIQKNPMREDEKQTSNGGERTEHREDMKLGVCECSANSWSQEIVCVRPKPPRACA